MKLTASISALLLTAAPVFAQNYGPLEDALTHRVITGWTQADGSHVAAIELDLAEGWKTYWRSPGDAGIPPNFDWSRTKNAQNIRVQWPTPIVFWESGMRSVGYKTRVVIPVVVTPKKTGQEIQLKGRMDLGLCSDICVPVQIKLDETLPAGTTDTRSSSIVAALAALPFSQSEAGVKNVRCSFEPGENGTLSISAQITMPSAGGEEQSIIEAHQPSIWVSEPKTSRSGDTLDVSAKMVGATSDPLVIDRSRLRFTVIGSSYAVDILGCSS